VTGVFQRGVPVVVHPRLHVDNTPGTLT